MMINGWWLPVVVSALCMGIYDICKKDAVKDNSVMPALFFTVLSGTLFFMAGAVCSGNLLNTLRCSFVEYFFVLIKSVIISSSWICVYYGMRELPVTIASPIRSTSPVWTLIGGILIFSERPGLMQILGVIICLIGYFMFFGLSSKEGFPWKSKGMVLTVAGSLLGAVSALYDKVLLHQLNISREVLQMYFFINLVLVMGIFTFIWHFFGQKRAFIWKWTIPATGILIAISAFGYFYGVSQPDTPISVVSVVRRCSCAVTFVLGALIFRDKNIREKAWALALLLAGVILLAF